MFYIGPRLFPATTTWKDLLVWIFKYYNYKLNKQLQPSSVLLRTKWKDLFIQERKI